MTSTKVSGLGVNLIGANRIIILDTPWNPADDMQCVYRIYRLGQSKQCYIYSLIGLVRFTIFKIARFWIGQIKYWSEV